MSFLRSKKLLLLIIFILSNFVIFTTNSSPSGDNIIITEVLYDAPNSDTTEEWFELFNPTDSLVDLSGWTIEDNFDSFSLSGTIPAKGYFVVAKQSAAFNALYGFDPDLGDFSLALSNSGDKLTLYNNASTEVDFVSWENYVSGWSVSAIDTTIRRINVVDTDTGVDWENSGSLGNPGDGPYDEILSDDTPPLVNILSPVSGANLTGSVEISVNATDENGIVRYEIYIDGILRATQNPFLWNTRTVSNGSHTILAKCKDPANNVGEHNITVTVENTDIISSSDLIKIMSYNIEYGIDPDWKDVVKEENPDIVIFVETGDWDDNSNELLNQYIAEFNAYFADEEPYTGYTAQGIVYSTDGEAIMSRYPILETVQIPLVTLDDDSMFDVSHDFMYWKVDVNGTELYLIGAHLKAMSGSDNEYRREREQEGIINYMDNLGEVPILYMGDLNSFSPDDTGALAPEGDLGYGPLTMMLKPEDPTYGQYSSENHIFTDVYRILNPTELGYTYGHQNPAFDSRIDFIIANDYISNYLVNSTVGDTTTADTGSDHYCVDFFLDINALQSQTDITAPAKVLGVSAEAINSSQINLVWNPSSEVDLDYYNIYRDGTYITQTINPSYSDSGLNVDTEYTYEITAVDTSGNEGIKSDSIVIRTQTETTVSDFPLSSGGLIVCLTGLALIMSKHIKKKRRT
jgi:endonuclease/exonuclease/phosphatase family metal-dependent hydrolase